MPFAQIIQLVFDYTEHKYRCPDLLARDPMLLLIKAWIQSVGTNCMFLKKRKTCIIYHFEKIIQVVRNGHHDVAHLSSCVLIWPRQLTNNC